MPSCEPGPGEGERDPHLRLYFIVGALVTGKRLCFLPAGFVR